MNPFLGTDLTEDKENEIINGDEFITQKTSESNTQAFEKAMDDNFGLVKEAKLPLLLRIIKGVCGLGGLILAGGAIKAWDTETPFMQMYEAAPWVFWVAGGCLAVAGVLELLSRKKAKAVLLSEEGSRTKNTLDTVVKNIYAELGVPSSATETDILSFGYKIKDGEIHPKARIYETTPFTNLIFRAFTDGESLHLANCEAKYSFPLSELKAIRTVNKRIMLSDWNKDEKPNKGIYKSYKISVNEHDDVYVKPYHVLELEHNGEAFGIYFPCYELPTFEKLTGLKADI